MTPAKMHKKIFKMYNKAKTTIHGSINKSKTKEEISYLEQIVINIKQCTHISDIEEIRTELEETDLKRKATKKC